MRFNFLQPWTSHKFWLIYNSTCAVLNAICAATESSVTWLMLHGLCMLGCVVCAAFSWYWMDEERRLIDGE